MLAPEPSADQLLGLMPFPMNRAANRFGGGGTDLPEADSLPATGSDSSQGSPSVTPTPVRNLRRVIVFVGKVIISVSKLATPLDPIRKQQEQLDTTRSFTAG
jgi:hypothetical protein